MLPRSTRRNRSGRDVRHPQKSGGYATGQLLGLLVVLLIGLPFLPLLLLIILWIRLKDRTQGRPDRQAAATRRALAHGLL
ncbi:hypothetical protein [Micromonospora sp. NBC_01796]|uniref:hypothetical protein n=1 Tax=Micromonospora sp. NBC_01796 TaxID=2975987 RepID=UPI002DDB1BFA|nr:hypothetical protein [Micromonospora sp. NBC_01796]WSA86860.1 hypothetical protein OIE47_04355 [Micromonospora sp. NBC_01796]